MNEPMAVITISVVAADDIHKSEFAIMSPAMIHLFGALELGSS